MIVDDTFFRAHYAMNISLTPANKLESEEV